MNRNPPTTETPPSTSANLEISRRDFVRYFSKDLVGKAFLWVTSHCPPSWGHRPFLSAGLVFQHLQRKCLIGKVIPAVIIDAKRGLVAAFSNLDATPSLRYPALRIYQEKLHAIHPPAKDGDRLPAICLYEKGPASERTGKWADFHPLLAHAISRDQERLEELGNSAPDDEWRGLTYALGQISGTAGPGLYEVELPSALHRSITGLTRNPFQRS